MINIKANDVVCVESSNGTYQAIVDCVTRIGNIRLLDGKMYDINGYEKGNHKYNQGSRILRIVTDNNERTKE